MADGSEDNSEGPTKFSRRKFIKDRLKDAGMVLGIPAAIYAAGGLATVGIKNIKEDRERENAEREAARRKMKVGELTNLERDELEKLKRIDLQTTGWAEYLGRSTINVPLIAVTKYGPMRTGTDSRYVDAYRLFGQENHLGRPLIVLKEQVKLTVVAVSSSDPEPPQPNNIEIVVKGGLVSTDSISSLLRADQTALNKFGLTEDTPYFFRAEQIIPQPNQ